MNPVIVLGMAHTGTTACARYLGSAPGWGNYTNGKEGFLLECNELLHLAAEPLHRAVGQAPDTRLVLKRPWAELRWQWLLQEFPDASYLIMLKPFADCWESWTKAGSAAERGLRGGTIEHAWAVWSQHMAAGSALVANAKQAAWIDFGLFCRWPRVVDTTLAAWGITGEFDSSRIRAEEG